MRLFRRLYRAGPGHALLMLGGFAFAGYVVDRIVHVSQPLWIAIWFGGAIVAHDMVLFPLYALADHLLLRRRGRAPARPGVPWVNHVRVPVVMSGILLLVSFPLVFRLSDRTYLAATGLHPTVYLLRWVLVSAGVFVASGFVYAMRRLVAFRSTGGRMADR